MNKAYDAGRRYEAVVLDRAMSARADMHHAFDELDAAGVHLEFVDDESDVFARLWSVGIAPDQVADARRLDASALRRMIEDQLRRRADVPEPVELEGWSIVVDEVDAKRERAYEAILTLADGMIGTSGAPLLDHPAAEPDVVAGGMYDGDGETTDLLPAPRWASLGGALAADDHDRRVLDLHTATLHERISGTNLVTSLRFVSLATPGVVALRATGAVQPRPNSWDSFAHDARLSVPTVGSDADPQPLLPPAHGYTEGYEDGRVWMATHGTGGSITAAAWQAGDADRLERIAAYATATGPPAPADARARLAGAEARGFNRLLRDHRAAWAKRWEHADIAIAGDTDLQRATRLGLFHMIGSVADRGEAAVGARGLTGRAYRGHVFWDADLFVLPFFAATHPAAARAMLEYRIRRLPDAQARAAEEGRAGARFPWESARTGFDVTPHAGRDQTGHVVPIRTGNDEVHITGDVAWAACSYIDWTGDRDFAAGPGLRILVETARYWASRIRVNGGTAHIYGVIGPDEYHEPVDDNAYTNVLARWNLRRAANAVREYDAADVRDDEYRHWLELADMLVDGYDAATGLYEQFAGFYGLEPLLIADVAPRRPVTADLLLGRDRVRGAQVVKQADVLMLHHLLPDQVARGSLEPNLDYYEPRTAHGSSLSPAIHASLFARAGRLDDAVAALGLAANIDLDDLTATGAGGVHLAAMGGVWQALAFGFMGLCVRGDVLTVDPRVPPMWRELTVRVQFRGVALVLRADRDMVYVDASDRVALAVDDRRIDVGPGGTMVPIERGGAP